jgi:hypothetical protein
MKRFLGLVIAAIGFTSAWAENSENQGKVEIPFSEIWAYNLSPGMREMSASKKNDNRPADPNIPPIPESVRRAWEQSSWVSPEGPLLDAIVRGLKIVPKGSRVGPGFAVEGRGMDALKAAYVILVEHKAPQKSFHCDREISMVIFSNATSASLVLDNVARDANTIAVKYHLSESLARTPHFSFGLIPLGRVAAGNYDIRITRTDQGEAAPSDPEGDGRVLCAPFSFTVDEESAK